MSNPVISKLQEAFEAIKLYYSAREQKFEVELKKLRKQLRIKEKKLLFLQQMNQGKEQQPEHDESEEKQEGKFDLAGFLTVRL